MKKINVIAEGGIMLALATALSFVRIVQFPWGGEVTLMSMLPIMIFAIRHGAAKGFIVSFLFSLIRLGQGMIIDGLFGWGLTPELLVACIMLDYILAFTVLGISGIFGKKSTSRIIFGKKLLPRIILGISLSIVARFICHLISGVVLFSDAVEKIWGLNIENPWLYSMLYNGLFIVPELVITLIGTVVLFVIPSTKKLLFINS